VSGFFVDLLGMDDDGFLWAAIYGKLYCLEKGRALLWAYPGYDTWKDVVDSEGGRVVSFHKQWVDLIGVDGDGDVWVVANGNPYILDPEEALFRSYDHYDTWEDVVNEANGLAATFVGWRDKS
jgi:hypothetical protein